MQQDDDTADTVLRDEAAFIQNVAQFYDQEMLSDVVLKVGDLRFFAHKFVLAKSSEVSTSMIVHSKSLFLSNG